MASGMVEFLQSSPTFGLLLTLGMYQAGLFCQRRWKHSLVNPLLIAILLVFLFLKLTGFSTERYQRGSEILNSLLTPATVCLAIPLYSQLKALRRHLSAVLIGVMAGTVACLLCVSAMAWAFHLDERLYFSLLPKGITTAMGMVLAERTGGMGAVTTSAIIFTGLLGSLLGRALFALLGITHPIARGVALGTAAHAIGTAKAAEMDELTGAASSLALVVAGIMTACIIPIVYGIIH